MSRLHSRGAASVLALVVSVVVLEAVPCEAEPVVEPVLDAAGGAGDENGSHQATLLQLLPIELTAFGDFRYRLSNQRPAGFELGAVELDAVSNLSPKVTVSSAFVYDAAGDVVRIGAFTVDGGLFGKGRRHHFESTLLETSGIVFGKFDVPFGVAYLEYPSTENRFVTLPAPVLAVHGGWNDLGVQAYAIASAFNAMAYVVNGVSFDAEGSSERPDYAAGGRLGLRPLAAVEVGGSAAWVHAPRSAQLLYGLDLSARTDLFEAKSEYLARRPSRSEALVQGFYSQALFRLPPFFVTARHENVFAGDTLTEGRETIGLGAQVLAQGEIRLVYSRSLERGADTLFVQVVGGSAWQPTGLRR